LSFVNENAPLFCCWKFSLFDGYLEGIDFPSKHNVAPLYWLLLLGVLCQRVKQIMVLSDHSLISLIFSVVKEYVSRMNLEILILHFKNKNYFGVSLE